MRRVIHILDDWIKYYDTHTGYIFVHIHMDVYKHINVYHNSALPRFLQSGS